jgi:hypothetical protein
MPLIHLHAQAACGCLIITCMPGMGRRRCAMIAALDSLRTATPATCPCSLLRGPSPLHPHQRNPAHRQLCPAPHQQCPAHRQLCPAPHQQCPAHRQLWQPVGTFCPALMATRPLTAASWATMFSTATIPTSARQIRRSAACPSSAALTSTLMWRAASRGTAMRPRDGM